MIKKSYTQFYSTITAMTQHTTPLYVPHLRFAEFSSNWEEKKLGEMLINKRIK